MILYGYDETRKLGEKHAAAIKEAVRYVRETEPRMRISETEVQTRSGAPATKTGTAWSACGQIRPLEHHQIAQWHGVHNLIDGRYRAAPDLSPSKRRSEAPPRIPTPKVNSNQLTGGAYGGHCRSPLRPQAGAARFLSVVIWTHPLIDTAFSSGKLASCRTRKSQSNVQTKLELMPWRTRIRKSALRRWQFQS